MKYKVAIINWVVSDLLSYKVKHLQVEIVGEFIWAGPERSSFICWCLPAMPTHATLPPLHQPTLITSWTALYYALTEEKESIVYRWLCIMSWRRFKWNAESYSVWRKRRWKILPAGRTLNGITSFPFPGKRQELIGSNRWFSPTDMDMIRIRRPEVWWQGGLGRSM